MWYNQIHFTIFHFLLFFELSNVTKKRKNRKKSSRPVKLLKIPNNLIINSKFSLFIDRKYTYILDKRNKKFLRNSLFSRKKRKKAEREKGALFAIETYFTSFSYLPYRPARKNTRSPAFASTIFFAFCPGTQKRQNWWQFPWKRSSVYNIITNTKPYALGTSKPCRSLVFILDTVARIGFCIFTQVYIIINSMAYFFEEDFDERVV